MSDYTFISLNDKEFESLSIDLLSIVENERIERFKHGRDGAVDGRFFTNQRKEVVIQCKHWVRSGLKALIRHLKNSELEKIKSLRPSRYILVTSIELSRYNKSTIAKLLSPYILSEKDIYGKEDLNDLLSTNPEIEKKHYKLWLSSINILNSILNNAILGRSAFKLDEIKDRSSKYVLTESYDKALEILESLHTVIIKGIPGIGKTALAENLCLFYIRNGFKLCYIQDSITEAESLFLPSKRQVFYFDDFLGSNYLTALNRHEDSSILTFIRRIGKDNRKRFILTSRTNILNQGKTFSDLFDIENIQRNEFEISLTSLTNLVKAKILYNHIWFSELNEEFIEEIYWEKRYRKIIKHRNYNPRLISFITDRYKITDIDPPEYWSHINKTLSNPANIWYHLFNNQIDEIARMIICLVVFNGTRIKELDLEAAIRELIYLSPHIGNSNIELLSNLKIVVGSLLNRSLTRNEGVVYDLFNPSVGDFVINQYSNKRSVIKELFYSLNTIESLKNLMSFSRNNVLNEEIVKEVVNFLVAKKIETTYDNATLDYKVILSDIALKKQFKNSENLIAIENFIKILSLENDHISYIPELVQIIHWGFRREILNSKDVFIEDFMKLVLDEPMNHEDLVAISSLIEKIQLNKKDMMVTKIKENIKEYWSYNIDQEISESDTLSDIHKDEDEEYASEILHDYIKNVFSEYNVEFNENEIEDILGCCDVSKIIEENKERAWKEDYEYERWREVEFEVTDEDEAIDDLFDRK